MGADSDPRRTRVQRLDDGVLEIRRGDMRMQISPEELQRIARTVMDFALDADDWADVRRSGAT